MKKHFFLLIPLLSIFSCKTVELTDGTRITKRQERKIYEKVFNETFGQMTEEEVALFEDVTFVVDTAVVDSSERIIMAFTDTSYVVEPSLTLYKKLIPSIGDTSITYMYDLIIVDSIKYETLEDHIWIDYRIEEIYE
jgi:hypothetical protein